MKTHNILFLSEQTKLINMTVVIDKPALFVIGLLITMFSSKMLYT